MPYHLLLSSDIWLIFSNFIENTRSRDPHGAARRSARSFSEDRDTFHSIIRRISRGRDKVGFSERSKREQRLALDTLAEEDINETRPARNAKGRNPWTSFHMFAATANIGINLNSDVRNQGGVDERESEKGIEKFLLLRGVQTPSSGREQFIRYWSFVLFITSRALNGPFFYTYITFLRDTKKHF